MAETKVAHLGLLLRCYEGLRNWRALLMLAAGLMIMTLLLVLATVITVKLGYRHPTLAMWMYGLLMLIALLVYLVGYNGAGLLLVDQADGQPPRPFDAAFFGALGATLQSVACQVILGVGLLVVVVVLWALSFLGRIPGAGGLFAFLLAGPTMVVMALCYAVLAFGLPLMQVAIWRGEGIIGSIGRAIDIVVKRPLDTVLHFIVLLLLVLPIELLVTAVMYGGGVLTMLMYAPSLSGGGYYGGGSVLGTMLARLVTGSPGSALTSVCIVIAAIFALFVLIGMLGWVLVYDSMSAGTDARSAEFLRRRAQEMKAKVDEHRPQAARAVAVPRIAPPQVAGATCAKCGAALTANDRFCGECGTPVD
jgi:hypothetical protein